MTRHPTDSELEAMAAKLEGSGCLRQIFEAAAMLRACKGRVRVKALVWEQARDGAGWHPQLTIAYCPVFEKRFYAEHPEKQAKIDAAREARILAALEPAPDHSVWNAAIEAAVREIDCGCDGPCMWPHACPKEDVESIRALKKGPPND